METLLSIAIALAAGLFVSRFMKPIKVPAVTGYLIAGILIGPYCLGRLGVSGLGFTSMDEVKALTAISEFALGFIAFAIGDEFRISQLKKIGRQATVIAFLQALAATFVIDVVLIGLHFILGEDKLPLSICIVMGAIGTATAPAATLMVVKQYKAKGKLVDMLLPIVALDDAIGLVVFAVSFGIAKALEVGDFSMISIIVEPLCEVIASLTLGLILGWLFSATEKFFLSNSKRMTITVTYVMLAVALSKMEFTIGAVHVSFSSLLVCMMMSTVFCNVCDFSGDLMGKADKWTAPLYVLFFVLSGAELELSVFADIAAVGIGVVYIISRSVGKIAGATVGAKIMKCDENIVKHLGITLLPQAGVALGMSLTAESLGMNGSLIRNITLFAVLIYELFGPVLTKNSLIKAGEIHPKAVATTSEEDDD